MAKKRHSAEQIVRKLREEAVELARRTVLAEGQGWCGTRSAAIRPAVAASRRIHFRNSFALSFATMASRSLWS